VSTTDPAIDASRSPAPESPNPPWPDASRGRLSISEFLRTSPPEPVPEGPRRRPDPRLAPYLIAGFAPLFVAIATGRHELAALGAPFLALAVMGLVGWEPGRLRGGVTVGAERAIEGDVVEGTVDVDWDGVAEVNVVLHGWRGVAPLDPAPELRWSLPAGRGPVTLPFRLRARAWGAHELGSVWVRARRPGGLLMRERKLADAPPLRVLPNPLRLNHLLKPAEARAFAGAHVSRLRGHGTDFAELRPYQPGDRLRDLSWATSARLGKPWVTVHHPERTGTVLLLLDVFHRDDDATAESFARAARAAWAVASVHLRAQDRVGLLARGRTAAWLSPRSGRRARWQLVDELLAVGGAAQDYWRLRRQRMRVIVPHDALIVGITTLRFHQFARNLLDYRHRGHTTVALVIDIADLLPGPKHGADHAARRIWLAQREAERSALDGGGVPTAVVTPDGGVGPAISALRHKMKGLRVGVRRGAAAR